MSYFKSYWTFYKKISKNKGLEAQLRRTKHSWFLFILSWSRRIHHAGLSFKVGFLGYEFHTKLYDFRHWDFQKDCWESPKDDADIKIDLT